MAGGVAQRQLPIEGSDSKAELMYPAGTISMLLMITDRRLRQLAQEGLIPKATRGRYPLVGCVQGYIKYLQGLKLGTDERSQESTRLTRARAATYELDLAVKSGELYSREVIDEAMFAVCINLAAMLDGGASRIASKLGGGAELRKRLVEEFHDIRAQFAAGLRDFSKRVREDGWHSGSAGRHRTARVVKKKGTAKRKR